ncbi:probable ATP-dependent RNA helicase DHX34 isoform X1 [Cylas formicarius]|uniref:probable ATP-dependent RNA helicase DHX34 isoform X1 n=1 Tax=Cylas formicarius TaxID=197179 RepID=UPI002958913B|nr:probable ATP-dependent RNA helicase DHX34 isoform X1 [Cylas formicarius]
MDYNKHRNDFYKYHKHDKRYQRGRSRSRSPADRKKFKRRSLSPKKPKKIDDYKFELARFLEENGNIKNMGDFWKFFEKYQNAQRLKANDPSFNRNSLLNFEFSEARNILYDKLPILDKHGEKIYISTESFDEFLLVIKVYQDFQQKTKFSKLKMLRAAQKDLPITQFKEEIIDKVKESRIVLIAGNTGCGKSTQVPQYVMEAGFKKIACTQPRRIACISLAKRVSYETLTDFKSTVGYQIRFEKTKRSDTKIIFMTEGLLLRQASEEETLNSYDVVILDEVHERHLYGDFLIGIMKCLLYKRQDIKLILMSATINIELFTNYFAEENIKVIQVPGRLYPIELHYQPIIKDPYERKREKFDCTPYLQILQMIDEKYPPHQKGDVLIFLNGFSEISTLADAVNEYSQYKKNWIVLPLHSSLSLEEQDKVFDYAPEGVRKCIISTNIAETSVTIDGIRFVIDSGKVNRMMYNTNLGVNKLSECNISQDSAKQRCGRAGRTGPGVCYRLYSEEDFRSFDAFTPAEIHLVPLDSLILHMVSLGLSDIEHFPFLEKPSQKAIEESLEKLKFTGALALDDNCLVLTTLGDALSQLPVDLGIGKMLIMSTIFGNVNSILALASLLSVQSPLTQNAYRDSEGLNLRKPLESNHGDPLSLLNFYKEWLTVKQMSAPVQSSSRHKSESSRTWSKKRCLEEQRFYEVTKLLEQFRDILHEANLLTKIEEGQLTSGERAIRYGELKHLKSLRHSLKNESKLQRRKQLKYEMYNFGEDVDESESRTDLRDVEFRISNDFKRLQKLLNEASADGFRDLMLLKLILTSGFYPQIAVEDEHNSSKTVSERLYHTKNKNYVFLRPMSYFAANPETLELHNDDVEVPPPGYFSKRPISKKHQVLVYQSILETKKVYLMNTMRMPCLQTLLLFGKTIATNSTLTKFLVDDFLLVDAPYFGQGKSLLLRAVELRKKWKRRVECKLNDPSVKETARDREEMFYFADDLVNFMTLEVSYNLKRLLPADLKELYKFTSEGFECIDQKLNPFDGDYVMARNDIKGGFNVTENVIFDCLLEEEWCISIQQEICASEYECKHCKKTMSGASVFRIMQHEEFCDSKAEIKKEAEEDVCNAVVKPNSKKYYCAKCDKDLMLTPTDILKHKRSCK